VIFDPFKGKLDLLVFNMPFCFHVEKELLGFKITFSTHIKQAYSSLGELAENIVEEADPVT